MTEARYYGDDADRVELNISVKGDITVGKKLVGYLKSHGYSRYDIIADDDILDAEDYGEDDPHILVSICDLPMGAIDKVLSKIDESGIEYDDYWEN